MFNRCPRPRDARSFILFALACGLAPLTAHAFCGFYVAQADTKIYNQASKVVMVRDGDRTVLTMSNDFSGAPEKFAMVIPVPTVITKEQVHAGEQAPIDHLDAYSAPRLVEYFDPDPCARNEMKAMRSREVGGALGAAMMDEARAPASSPTVHIEASYTVGEYDILILSATQSGGLVDWLKQNDYRIPEGAEAVLDSYIKQNIKFFVAKVNLREQKKLGFSTLRPIQIAFESPKFMLPIRLGMVNSRGEQELFVFAITRRGRVETTNYRTEKLPTGQNVPLYVKAEFSDFYKAVFSRQHERSGSAAVQTEYFWNMGSCDPCAAPPLDQGELRKLGVFWLDEPNGSYQANLTRLHVRYDREHFPEDLVFQETGDQQSFQGRYVLNHPATPSSQCSALAAYHETLRVRYAEERKNLNFLTGWAPVQITRKMTILEPPPPALQSPKRWWNKLWGN